MVFNTRALLQSCLVKIFVLVSVWCVVEGRSCSEFDNCTLCISSSLGCKWCSDVDFNGSKCLESSDYSKSCKSGFEDPPSTSSIVEDVPFSDSIQVYPQALSVNLRPGKPATFNVSIKPAPTFPLDVYFLMDFTESMKDDLAAIRSVAYKIGRVIRSISSNYRVGLGSFSDKKVTPMEPPTIYQRRNPCLNSGGTCPPNYSFRNLFSLGDSRNFFLKIRDSRTSGNFDPPEGGMDALLQTIVCTDVIGWRPEPARRLLVYISDGPFHYGYDGKIAGVVTPHDGKCHMRKSADGPYEEYTEAERLDYPSISMIAAKLQEFNIHPVFGVPVANASESQQGNPVYNLYKNLSDHIPNAVVQPLSPKSENLVEAVQSAYYKIANNVQLSLANGKLDDIDVKFEAFCNGTELTNGTTCPDVLIGQEVSFRVSVTAKRCTPELLSGNTKLTISTGFFGSVTVNLSAVCDCDCVNKQVEAAEECSGLGTLTCGKCHCDPGIYGKVCECGVAVNGSVPTCETGTNGMLCSGPKAGECYCGECMCNKDVGGVKGHMYYGEACECNNFECQLGTNNKMCSGHGTCGCGGVCECDTTSTGKPYTGDVCECYPDDDTCRSSPLEVPCGGHGTCKCGLCECEPGFAGEFCGLCVSNKICGRQTCRAFDDCISCIFTIEEETVVQHNYEDCMSLCNNMTIHVSSRASSINSGNDTLECKSTISSQTCSGLSFFVRTTDNVIYVASTPSNCVRYIQPWLIVVPIVVGLLLLAIAIIVFAKLFIVYLDYREYRNWLSDLKGVKFSETENPVFLSAWEKFYCPMYPGNFEKGLIGSISSVKANSDDTDSDGGSYKDSPRPRKHNMRNPMMRIKYDSKFGQSRSVPTLLEDEEVESSGGSVATANGSTVSVHQDQTKQVRSQDLLNRDDDETLHQLIMSLTKSDDSHDELVESV